MQSECNPAALIIFPLILTHVPQTACVAFMASLDQMFHLAGFTSNSVVLDQETEWCEKF